MEMVFNKERALKRTMGDRELLSELLNFTLQDLDEQLIAIRDALNQENFNKVKEEAHKLKGSAGAVGADMLFQQAFDLEQKAKGSDIFSMRESMKLVEEAVNRLLMDPVVGEYRNC